MALAPAWPAAAEEPSAVTLHWEAIEGASGYVVEVARDAQFTDIVAHTPVSVSTLTWQPPALATYFWRVRVMDAYGRVESVVEQRPFYLAEAPELQQEGSDEGDSDDDVETPAQSTPAAPAAKKRPAAPGDLSPSRDTHVDWAGGHSVLHWRCREGVSYEVQLARDRAFRHSTSYRSGTCSVAVVLGQPGTYVWRVRGRAPTTEWSTAAAFVADASTPPAVAQAPANPIAPGSASPDASPTTWTLHGGALVGAVNDFGAVWSPRIGLDLHWRTPVRAVALGAAATVAYQTSAHALRLPSGPGSAAGRVHAIPIDLVAEAAWPLPALVPFCAAGLRLSVAHLSTDVPTPPAWPRTQTLAGVLFAAGAERSLGPGVLSASLVLSATGQPDVVVSNEAVAWALNLGYRVRLL